MSPEQFANEMQNRLNNWRAIRTAEALKIGVSLAGQVKLRVSEFGTNAAGAAFAPYTPEYSKRRAKLGFQVQYVDFVRSGALMRDINAYVLDETAGSVTISITARRGENQDKLAGAIKKRGNILTPSKDELDLAVQAYQARQREILGI